jgi:sulfur relay (sulfurtransferase) DsrF/TusC family protein
LPSSIVVVIQEDPQKSGRAVEALRIALGLGAGENPMTVVLLNQAPLLLSEDTDDIVDVDILEKHLPVFKELNIPFLLEQDSRSRFSLDTDFTMREASESDIANTIATADRVLVF